MIGEELRIVVKLLMRIGILDKQSLIALPLNENKGDLTQVIADLKYEGEILPDVSTEDVLGRYELVRCTCRFDVSVPPAVSAGSVSDSGITGFGAGRGAYIRRSVFTAMAPGRGPLPAVAGLSKRPKRASYDCPV